MLQRCINAASDKEELIAVLRDVADDSCVEQIIRDEANSFLKRRGMKEDPVVILLMCSILSFRIGWSFFCSGINADLRTVQ